MAKADAERASGSPPGTRASRAQDFRYWLEHGIYHTAMWPVHRFSHENAGRLGEHFSRLVFHLLLKSARLSRRNLRLVFPERDERELAQIARASYACFGRVFLEQVSFRRFSKAELLERFEVVGRENLERARALQRGLILLTGHFGAFDVSAFPITQEIGTCHVLIRPPSNPYLRAEFEQVRQRLDSVLVPRARAGHRLYNLLRQGACIGLALDQRVRPWDGLLVDFLGHPAWTSPVPAFLAWKSRAPVLPLFCVPLPGARYRLEIREPIVIEDERYDPGEITRRLSAELEHEIRAHPELWFWPHDRWRLDVRHRTRQALKRIHREARLEPVLGEPAAERPPGPALGDLGSGRFLECAEHLSILGSQRECHRWARRLAEALLARGFAVQAIDLPALIGELASLDSDVERRRRMHGLDAAALLLLAGAEELRERRHLDLLAELLEHRRLRGSVALLIETRELGERLAPSARRFLERTREILVGRARSVPTRRQAR
ncbi:MAG TPA: lysophospholipid acyltransferase family protein [Thermoanaerobaculia bacterium]|nr:lysophospholipid acyltransferase family protein [Thermoanaerobaculia bacterium]